MNYVHLRDGDLRATVSSEFGAIWAFEMTVGSEQVPLLRPSASDAAAVATAAGCFPLLPFANRVRGNSFVYEGRQYDLEANTDWDRHYLHGEGWTSDWRLIEVSPNHLVQAFEHGPAKGTPYVYEARQAISLRDGCMTLTLSVTNRGDVALPFGLGWHPFFPLTPKTTLRAAATSYWQEDEQWLPTELCPLSSELDFNTNRHPPRHWVNNGFEGWDGQAEIVWPERGVALDIEATDIFRRYFVFVSDTNFDPTFKQDFFCFEPMSHAADAHHSVGGGGLRHLAPGEWLSGSTTLRPKRLQCRGE